MRTGLTLWIVLCTVTFILATLCTVRVDAATTRKIRRNSTLIDSRRGLTPQASIGIPRRLPSPWRGKLSRGRARAPSPAPSPEAAPTTPPPPEETEAPPSANVTFARDEEEEFGAKKRVAALENIPDNGSLVWPVRSRPAKKRFRMPTPTTPAPQVLLKLLQPKPTRPAIYSLDGFVPKPSIRVVVSTEPPPNFHKTDLLQGLGSVPRRKKVYRYSKEDEDEDELQSLSVSRRRKKPVSRYTAFARKGVPGEDFPVFTFIPLTDFDCGPQPGLYADPYTDCQVWHMCPGGHLSPRHSFLCPNGTIFNQKKRICDWWYNVDCRKHSRKIRP